MRKFCGQPCQILSLMLPSTPKQAVMRRPPVGQEQRPGRVQVARQEPREGRGNIPCSGRQVDDGGSQVFAREALVQHRHTRHRGPGVLVEHEGVPGCKQRSGESGHHNCVVNVGDDSESRLRIDNEDWRGHGPRILGAQGDGVPTRRQVQFESRVDYAAAVGRDVVLLFAGRDNDGDDPRGDTREAAPAANAASADPVLRVGPQRAHEKHATEYPDPALAAVTGVRDDGRQQSALTCPLSAKRVEGVLEARSPVQGGGQLEHSRPGRA